MSTAKFLSPYVEALVVGDSDQAEKVIDEALAAGLLPSRVYLDVLMAAQAEIGERWHNGDVTVAAEHVATQITISQTARLRSLLRSRVKLGVRAAVTTVAGDKHILGAQAVADFLIMDGWEVDYLGAETPAEELASYIKQRGSGLLCLSISMADHIHELRRVVETVKAIDAPPKVIVGGRAVIVDPSLVQQLAIDGVAKDPPEAVTLARQLCGLLSSENALAIYLRKLGLSVHEYRKLRGMSQQDLAASSGLDRAYISSVEHGKQNISIGAVSKLARALGVSIEELLGAR